MQLRREGQDKLKTKKGIRSNKRGEIREDRPNLLESEGEEKKERVEGKNG